MGKIKEFLKRKDVVFSAHRYGIDAMVAMAQGLFASFLIGTIIKTLGEQIGLQFLVDAGTFAQSVAGPAMAASIGYALHTPPLVLFSLIAVGSAANSLGGAGGPLAVYFIAIVSAECGKLVSKETKVDIIVTPAVTILVGTGLSVLFAPAIGAAASAVGSVIMNRVRSSFFPNSVSGVIYQGGQFSPVASGRLAYRLEQGVASDCMSAAQAVLGGTSTTNCLYFRVNNGIIEGTVIGNHVFY